LLFRALRKRRQIRSLRDNTGRIGARDVLCFVTLRNEMNRLPYFWIITVRWAGGISPALRRFA